MSCLGSRVGIFRYKRESGQGVTVDLPIFLFFYFCIAGGSCCHFALVIRENHVLFFKGVLHK